jgi:Protein of unknown function (DUF1552)
MAHTVRTRTISRRALLRGAGGVAIALPLLEAMLPRRAGAAAGPPQRFLVWMSVNGTVVERWICPPAASAAELKLSEILAPLERHKADMVGVQNLKSFSGYGHAYPSNLTGRQQVDVGYPLIYGTGASLDQHIAKQWAGQTPIPSLQLGVQIDSKDRDTSACVSWSSDPHPDQTVLKAAADKKQPPPTRGLPAENNPFAVFARLFSNGTPAGAGTMKRNFSMRRSMLDGVLGQMPAFSQQLGKADRAIVDNYLESVRSIEGQITALEAKGAACVAPMLGTDPTVAGANTPWWMQQANVAAVLKLHGDLIASIFACDLTRVVVLTVAGSGGASRMPPSGLLPTNDMGDWHGVSHTIGKGTQDMEGRDGLAAIDKWYYDKLAVMLDSLKGIPELPGGTLLSNSLVLATNEYGPNGDVPPLGLVGSNNSHMCKLMPTLLFGQAGGALKTGRWLVTPMVNATQAEGHHLNRLYVSIMNALGIPDQQFGDPAADQGPLDGLLG